MTDYRVTAGHAISIGAESHEPGSTFSDKDVDKEVLKQLQEEGQIIKAESEKKEA